MKSILWLVIAAFAEVAGCALQEERFSCLPRDDGSSELETEK